MQLEMHNVLLYNKSRGDFMRNLDNYKEYTVIIGDIIDSKSLSDRKKVQAKFKKTLDEINQNYDFDIASKFTITLGDEFQGLLKKKRHAITIILEIERMMLPTKMRFGVGIGEISTNINFEQSTEIDGPAYHRARAMINELETRKNQYLKPAGNILLASQEEQKEIYQLLNSILSVTAALKSNWTSKQKEVIEAYRLNDENQSRAAENLGIAQSSVSRGLSNSNYFTYKSAIERVNSFLNQKGEC